MHLRDQVVHMCCAACWALDCSLGRTKQLRPSVGFCSLMRAEMAVVALSISQKSRVSKALANAFLVGVSGSARAVEVSLSSWDVY